MTAYAIMSADDLVCVGIYSSFFDADDALDVGMMLRGWHLSLYTITCPKCGQPDRHTGFCPNHEENQS